MALAHSVTLTWAASPDTVNGYNVYRGTNPPGAENALPLNAALITGLTYVDTAVVAGEKLDYVVTAVSAAGLESIHSNEVTVTVPLQPPSNLVATVI